MEKKELAMKEIRISELRALDISGNDDNNEMIIEGYAAVFETETDLGWCKEIISPLLSTVNSKLLFLVLARIKILSL